ncbi:single-stranded-DNA-specific exonuclease RecJ [Salibacterium aidingense]|uniref:single-stranded-DNA-specific exonuclease RecJ n=1 Tax=Salibacterium aidingense TaxID=384933 RepID=UPI003BE644D7
MLRPNTRWKYDDTPVTGREEMKKELNLSPLTAELMWKRGFRTAEEAETFLNTNSGILHDPYEMDGMTKAVHRIQEAVGNKEKILIFGDYDADGVASTMIMIHLMKELQADFGWYIPNRFTEGYGPNIPALERAKEEGASLVVTVDTGIAAVPEVKAANEMGLDIIITDHHEPPPELPEAHSIINPKKPGCPYPFKELAGAGVAFKTAQALLGYFPEHLLDILTIGTISDLVPLLDENRTLATRGLEALAVSRKPGIQALKRICGIEDSAMEEDHVGFALGPRINAAGRMESADPAVHLLAASDEEEAQEWAEIIDGLNKERQKVVNQMTKEAVEEVEKEYPPGENKVLLVGRKGWSPGVIGIVASRLTDRFYRPAIVLGIDEETGEAKGSARSIEGFDMFQELSKNKDLLPHFGGHTMAAGLTMAEKDISELRNRLENQAADVLSEEDFIPTTTIDVQAPLEEITVSALEELRKMAPFGVGNPKPIFMVKDVMLASKRKIGSEKNHLKIEMEENGTRLDGVGFHLGGLEENITEHARVSVVGELSINEWNGFRKPQLFLKDMAVSSWQLFDKRQQKGMDRIIHHLEDDDTIVVTFQEESYKKLGSLFERKHVLLAADAGEVTYHAANLILADMPSSIEELTGLLSAIEGVERVYAFFEDHDTLYFQSTPAREEFKWYYAFLKKRKTFNVHKDGEELARKKGWKFSTVSLMTEVFFELDFVTMENGIITVNDAPVKKDLTNSFTYQKHVSKKQAEQELLYSTYSQLKEVLDPFISAEAGDNKEMKEKVGHGF